MKNFKLRAWHYESKQMLFPPSSVDSMVLCRNSNGDHRYWNGEELHAGVTWDGRYYLDGRYQEMEWMFWTGLLDKNNKEIYQGDIVKHSMKEPHEWSGVHEVVFHNAAFLLKGGNPYGMRYGEIFNYYPMNVEVIGNKYENPELLEKV